MNSVLLQELSSYFRLFTTVARKWPQMTSIAGLYSSMLTEIAGGLLD